jgi:hypothetical protein
MIRASWTALTVLLVMAAGVRASDPVGIYAVIDKVLLTPSDNAPEQAQVWGVFRLAQAGGDTYTPPVRGYLCYRLTPGKEEVCRREWADLRRVADTGQCVAFASRYAPKGTVRPANEPPKDPDPYPVAFGLQRVQDDHNIARQLRSLPSPLEPLEGDYVPPGRITLRVRALPGGTDQTRYVFEIERNADEKEMSEPIAAAGREVKWSPQLSLKAGARYTWRVWTTGDKGKEAVAVTPFQVKGRP